MNGRRSRLRARTARLATACGLVVACVTAVNADAVAAVSVAACFGRHMVLQRDVPLPVWGTAAPRETVRVALGAAVAEAVADAHGRWRAELPPQAAAAEPRSLVIHGAMNEVRIDDVLVGEVWLCAGQSNMLLPLARASGAARGLAAADRPRVRLLHLRTAAGGDPPAYTPAQVRDLVPERFCSGSWAACTPATARDFSAVGYFLAAAVEESLGVPVGVICAAVGGSPTEAWVSRAGLAAGPETAAVVAGDWTRNPVLAGWCVERATRNLARARKAGEAIPGDAVGPSHPFKPGFLWESCVAPLVPMAIRGVAWYQGESNADSPARVAQHAALFPALVADWRREWRRDDLPFAVVQLPGLNRPDWPAFRETQRRAVEELAHAGMVVTIDLGMKNEVHPPDKKPIGERLAAWALAEVYERPDVVPSGPAPAAAEFRGDGTVVVRFDHAGGLATTDGAAPRHFAVAGDDGLFAAAEARVEGDTVVVAAATGTTRPAAAVRHAWVPFPEPPVNLVNAAGLPATPFELRRTEPADR